MKPDPNDPGPARPGAYRGAQKHRGPAVEGTMPLLKRDSDVATMACRRSLF